jgi:hypothetical protein
MPNRKLVNHWFDNEISKNMVFGDLLEEMEMAF